MSGNEEGLIVISGAGGALGSRLVSHFVGRNRSVLALDRRFDNAFEENERLLCRNLDLTSESDVGAALAAASDRFGQIGLLVNTVGMIWNEPVLSFRQGRLEAHSLDNWRMVLEANLTAAFVVASAVASRMARSGGGAIVNFSSIAARGNSGQVAYSAAKAGIEGMTVTMARELGPMGVRVNALAPGFIEAPTTRANVADDQLKAHIENTPLGRLGAPRDVIGAVEFLASNEFVNGVVLRIDGGLHL
jgi:3-oxoacyl-[acyl-carrier protein] reductase